MLLNNKMDTFEMRGKRVSEESWSKVGNRWKEVDTNIEARYTLEAGER